MSDDRRTGMNPALKIILIVAGVLCLLVCGAIAVLGLLVKGGVDEFRDLAQTELTKAQLLNIETAIQQYRLKNGELPGDLSALIGPEGFLDATAVPADAWDRPFEYEPGEDGTSFDLYSLGADGIEGGEGQNADITRDSVRQR